MKVYADCGTISVMYWDEDDDIIPINSQDELSEAFKVRYCGRSIDYSMVVIVFLFLSLNISVL